MAFSPELKTGALFGCTGFLLVMLRSYAVTEDPLHALLYGLGTFAVLMILGHKVGHILQHPQGKKRSKKSKSHAVQPAGPPITGEETFVEDL